MTEAPGSEAQKPSIAELLCRRCWWREGRACYNDKLLRAGGVNKIPRTVEGDDRNGMELTDELWSACPVTSRVFSAMKSISVAPPKEKTT